MICDRARAILDVRTLGLTDCETLIVENQRVRVEATPCTFGGERYWLVCPRCSRRCVALYRPLACRICLRGHYRSEHMSTLDRKIDRAMKLRERLGQTSPRLIDPPPPKPKLMRWHTYLRLRARIDALEREIFDRFERMMKRM